jgi:PAS domain S-box-containing protein
MNALYAFLSYIPSVVLGGCLLAFMSAVQKMYMHYPLYPASFILPFTAGAIAGLLYHLRWKLEQKHHTKVKQYNKRLETILETVQSGIIIIDANTQIIESINSTAQQLYGYSDTEVVGKKCYDYLCDINPMNCPVLNLDNDLYMIDKTEIKTQKASIPVLRKAKNVSIDNDMHIIVNVTDISQIVESEEKLQEANQRVQIADRLKTEFLTNVGHEIRTPLNAVIGISDLLMTQDLSDETIKDVQLIKNSGKSLLKTMESIMDYAMLKSGNYELNCHTFDLYETLYFVSEVYSEKAATKGLKYHIDVENCNDMQYVGDQSALNKVLSNVLDNAVKFTPSGSVTLKTSFIKDPSAIDIQISDTGIGIPEEKQGFIYDAFYQADGSMSRNFEGTGMGLALVDFYIQKMGISIELESLVDKGTTFHILLPLEST